MELDTNSLRIPQSVADSAVLTGNRLRIAADITASEFFKVYTAQVEQPTLTVEKAFYLSLLHCQPYKLRSVADMLNPYQPRY